MPEGYHYPPGRRCAQLGDERNDVPHEVGDIGHKERIAGGVRVRPPSVQRPGVGDAQFVAGSHEPGAHSRRRLHQQNLFDPAGDGQRYPPGAAAHINHPVIGAQIAGKLPQVARQGLGRVKAEQIGPVRPVVAGAAVVGEALRLQSGVIDSGVTVGGVYRHYSIFLPNLPGRPAVRASG